jgi:hypothetical protein
MFVFKDYFDHCLGSLFQHPNNAYLVIYIVNSIAMLSLKTFNTCACRTWKEDRNLRDSEAESMCACVYVCMQLEQKKFHRCHIS